MAFDMTYTKTTLFHDFIAVVNNEWRRELVFQNAPPKAVICLSLLESDLESLWIALEDYLKEKEEVDVALAPSMGNEGEVSFPLFPKRARSRMFHNAKVFIVCMRRFARLLKLMKSRKSEFPQYVGDAIDLAWKKNRSFFNNYKEARDAIEHIDEKLEGHNKFHSMLGDYFEVVEGKRAHITQTALNTAEGVWEEIVKAIMRPVEERVRGGLMRRILSVLQARTEKLVALR